MDSSGEAQGTSGLEGTQVWQELALVVQSGDVSGPVFAALKRLIAGELQGSFEERMEAKTQMIKSDLSSLSSALDKRISEAAVSFSTVTTQTQQLLSDFQASKAATEATLQTLRDDVSSLTKDLGKLKSEVRMKAEAIHLNDAIEQMSTYTPLRTTEKLEAVLRTYPSYEDLSRLSDRVNELSTALSDYVTGRELTEAVFSVRTGIQEAVKDLAPNRSLLQLKSALDSKIADLENAYDRTRKLIDTQAEISSQALNSLQTLLETRPWMEDLTKVRGEMEKRAFASEVRGVKEDLEDWGQREERFEEEVRGQMEGFESVLERFDEVILLKASREDCKALSIQIQDPAPVSALHVYIQGLETRIDTCENSLLSAQETAQTHTSQLLSLSNAVKPDDLSVLREQIEDLKADLSRKVEQEEIVLLREQKGDREDASILHSNLRLHHKQLEQVTVLVTAVLRTLMKTDTRQHKVQQREYLLKHCEVLGNWVAGFDPGIYHEPQERRDLWSPRDTLPSARYRSPRDTPKLPLLATSRLRGRHGRVHSTVGTEAPLKL